jgi:hypothetical protein
VNEIFSNLSKKILEMVTSGRLLIKIIGKAKSTRIPLNRDFSLRRSPIKKMTMNKPNRAIVDVFLNKFIYYD